MHYVGIDWADTSHQIAIVTADGNYISDFSIAHNSAEVNKLCQQLARLAPVKVSIERPDGLLVDHLLASGLEVFVIPPRIMARRRPRHSKDDRSDARLLAHLLRTGDEECHPLERHSSRVETLRQLFQAFEQLQRQQLRFGNQLREIVKAYYPVLLTLFSDVTTNVALAFLETYPNPAQAQQLTCHDLKQFLKAQHYTHLRRLDTLYRRIQQVPLKAAVWEGYSLHAQSLIPLIRLLNQQMTVLKRNIRQTFAGHPESAWWQSLPGSGDLTGPRLLASFGDNRAVFPTAEMLQAHAGTVPVTRHSGKAHAVCFRRACDKSFRKALMDFARNSLEHSGWANSYYASQLERGHDTHRASRALANRWVSVLWTIWSKREPYDETRHIMNRSRKGQAA
jgi:transposase